MSNAAAFSARLEVALIGRDRLSLELRIENGVIQSADLRGRGCDALLALLMQWRPRLKGPIEELPLPIGEGHADILMRELILKAKGQWNFPYADEEICHCRSVPTRVVDAAIVGGCKTSQAVSRETSASTSCGACRPDVEAILKYRLNRN